MSGSTDSETEPVSSDSILTILGKGFDGLNAEAKVRGPSSTTTLHISSPAAANHLPPAIKYYVVPWQVDRLFYALGSTLELYRRDQRVLAAHEVELRSLKADVKEHAFLIKRMWMGLAEVNKLYSKYIIRVSSSNAPVLNLIFGHSTYLT
jgi:hypothetical protein